MTAQPHAVFVSYSFPPNGGSGVQRVYKFVKYLPDYGISTSVITKKSILKATQDSTLLDDLSKDTVVVRATSADPMFIVDFLSKQIAKPDPAAQSGKNRGGERRLSRQLSKLCFEVLLKVRNYLRLPDQYLGWLPFAIPAGRRHLRSIERPVIIASLPIYTTAIVGYCLSRLSGAPLVLDFRDGWADDPYLTLPTRLHLKFHQALERKIVNHASHLVVYGEWLADIYKTKFPGKPTTVILNGYDQEDFQVEPIIRTDMNETVLVYCGSLYQYHRDFLETLFSAVSKIPAPVRKSIRMKFIGDIQFTGFDDVAEKWGVTECIQKLGYIAHKQAIRELVSADALLFTIPRGDVSSYTSKIFEYLAARRPIISFVCEQGCGARLLKDFGHGEWLIDYDVDKAARILAQCREMQGVDIDYKPEQLARIDRKEQARALAKVLQELS